MSGEGTYQAKFGTVNQTVSAQAPILAIDVEGVDWFWISFSVATAVLSAFVVKFAAKVDGTLVTIASAPGDYVTPTGPVLGASADLTTAAIAQHFLKLDVTGVKTLQLEAAGTASVIAGEWGAE